MKKLINLGILAVLLYIVYGIVADKLSDKKIPQTNQPEAEKINE